jgi:hypothetical protein
MLPATWTDPITGQGYKDRPWWAFLPEASMWPQSMLQKAFPPSGAPAAAQGGGSPPQVPAAPGMPQSAVDAQRTVDWLNTHTYAYGLGVGNYVPSWAGGDKVDLADIFNADPNTYKLLSDLSFYMKALTKEERQDFWDYAGKKYGVFGATGNIAMTRPGEVERDANGNEVRYKVHTKGAQAGQFQLDGLGKPIRIPYDPSPGSEYQRYARALSPSESREITDEFGNYKPEYGLTGKFSPNVLQNMINEIQTRFADKIQKFGNPEAMRTAEAVQKATRDAGVDVTGGQLTRAIEQARELGLDTSYAEQALGVYGANGQAQRNELLTLMALITNISQKQFQVANAKSEALARQFPEWFKKMPGKANVGINDHDAAIRRWEEQYAQASDAWFNSPEGQANVSDPVAGMTPNVTGTPEYNAFAHHAGNKPSGASSYRPREWDFQAWAMEQPEFLKELAALKGLNERATPSAYRSWQETGEFQTFNEYLKENPDIYNTAMREAAMLSPRQKKVRWLK